VLGEAWALVGEGASVGRAGLPAANQEQEWPQAYHAAQQCVWAALTTDEQRS
jgi:hypothetical protein